MNPQFTKEQVSETGESINSRKIENLTEGCQV